MLLPTLKSFAVGLRRRAMVLASAAVLPTTVLLPGCSHGEAETPHDAQPRREPAWISGEIMGVDRIPVDQYNGSTIRLLVTTEGDTKVRVELGPGWYMEEKGLSFEPKQRIEFRAQPGVNGDSYVALELKQGEKTVELRDQDGVPRWSGKAPEGSNDPSTGAAVPSSTGQAEATVPSVPATANPPGPPPGDAPTP